MIRLIVSLVVLTSFAGITFANDTSITAVGGSAVPLHEEHPQVRMVRETVHLDLYKDYYVTTVDFVFTNDGKGTTVSMGFPERGTGVDGTSHTGTIQRFITTVDGHAVTAKRTPAASDSDSYQAYWTKSVSFARGQQRHIHVQFRSPYGAGIGKTLAEYDFTGGNWRGKVDKSLLIVTSHPNAPVLPFAQMDGHQLPTQHLTSSRSFAWHHWEAEGQFLLSQVAR